MNRNLLLLLALMAASPAAAQTTFRLGVRGGLNRATTTTNSAGNFTSFSYTFETNKTALYAWQAGAVAEISFGRLALQPALLFSQKGEHLTYTELTTGIEFVTHTQVALTSRYNWLELPLTVVYALPRAHGLQLLAGPYVALAVGRQRGTSVSYGPAINAIPFSLDRPVTYGDSTAHHRFDMGLNFGLGYRRGPAQVQLSYGLGLLNLRQPNSDYSHSYSHDFMADAARNRVVQLMGTYFFKL